MESASVTIQLVPADVRRFSKFVFTWRKRWKTRILAILAGILVPVSIAVILHTPADQRRNADDSEPSRFSESLRIWTPFLLFAALYGYMRWRASRPSTYQGSSPGLFLPNTCTVFDEGLFCQNERGETLNYWKVVVRFAETDDYFFVLLAERNGHILPKRCFPTLEAMAIFANQVRQQLEKHAPGALTAP